MIRQSSLPFHPVSLLDWDTTAVSFPLDYVSIVQCSNQLNLLLHAFVPPSPLSYSPL